MSSIRDEIKVIIFKALPSLSEDTRQQIITTLERSGVESIEDLKYVQQDDISNLLPVIQQRKLLQSFKMVQSCSSPSALSSSSSASSPGISSRAIHSVNRSSTWPETFEVPRDKMPEEVQSAIANNKRPAPDKRRQMIQILVDEIRKYEANPTRNECLIMCRNIVRQYPSSTGPSSADMTPGGKMIGGGYTSLVSQVKTRIENINREGTLKRHRSTRMSEQQQKPTDSYGCTQFQPAPPTEETNESLERKQQQLENIYRQEGIHGGERAEVIHLMKTTFSLQRNQINQTPWPYLFTQKGIYCHFELLTGVNVLHAMEQCIQECGQGIETYLRTKAKNMVALSQNEDVELSLRLIQLLMTYFDENIEGLLILADVSYVNIMCNVIILKMLLTSLSIENHVICEGVQPSFTTGLAAVFAVYYVLNLQYQEEASRTLEFVHRCFVGINPEKGTKAYQGKVVSKKTGKLVQKKVATVNSHVATLIKKTLGL
uniref:Uncharacterized protein n=1 Tax=Paramormyrops kingsleyae TaxID=1676925 RepID=A0A3B3T6F9_9TELE